MAWYYAESGKQVGPVADDEFQSLVNAGTIRADTLVWKDGMPSWQPYSAAVGAGSPLATPPATTAQSVTVPAGAVICAECRQPFAPEQTVRFGDAFVCPSCKPIYVQKLREGAVTETPGTFRYGGFWIRVVAKMIDSVIVMIPAMILFFVFGMGMFFQAGSGGPQSSAAIASMMGMQLGIQVIVIAISALYTIFFVTRYQATPGKMIFGLIVVNADGSRVAGSKATGRFFAEMLSGMICYIGYILAGFDEQKRTLHDHICSTRVVYKK